jgi:hypothetical protein
MQKWSEVGKDELVLTHRHVPSLWQRETAPLHPSEQCKPTPVTNSIPGHGTYPELTTECTKTVQLCG